MKIFVSIISYRDPLLALTINSLLKNKSNNHEITIGIFEQTAIEDSLVIKNPLLLNNTNIRYKRIDPEFSDGVGWARHINCLQVKDEDFIYQIDSHMLFEQDWDNYLVDDWTLGKEKHNTNKIIITGNCKNFDLDETGVPILHYSDLNVTCKGKYFLWQHHDIVAAHGEQIEATADIEPAIHIFAGNFFTHTSWLKDVGIDANIYFDGEELLMVLSSFAAGYHLYHPRSIHCYHYTKTGEYLTKQWYKPIIPMERYSQLTTAGQEYWQAYVNSLDRSILEKYYEYSGVDYINKKIDERAMTYQITVSAPIEETPIEVLAPIEELPTPESISSIEKFLQED